MYTVVATVTINDLDNARQALAHERVNLVRHAPGFVGAYWLAPPDGTTGIGMSVTLFESHQHAKNAARVSLPPLPGVTPLGLEIREVVAHA